MALTLSRQVDEVIEIQTPQGIVEVMVQDIRGDKVRLNITAPASFPIHRQEVAEAIRREQAAAAKANIVKLQQRGI